MYNTASNLEDLDMKDELNSYNSVGHAMEHSQLYDLQEEYRNVDFYILMVDNSEEDKIKDLLRSCGYTAWLEYENEMIEV